MHGISPRHAFFFKFGNKHFGYITVALLIKSSPYRNRKLQRNVGKIYSLLPEVKYVTASELNMKYAL